MTAISKAAGDGGVEHLRFVTVEPATKAATIQAIRAELERDGYEIAAIDDASTVLDRQLARETLRLTARKTA